MAKRDYYDVLGVARTATAEQIKKAYRALARKHHPDVNKSRDAAAKFAEIQEAYDVLSDATKRAAYDRYGHIGVGAGFGSESGIGPGGPGVAGFGGPYVWTTGGGDWSEGGVGDRFGDAGAASILEGLFGPARGASGRRGRGKSAGGGGTASRRGADINVDLEISFLTSLAGGKESIRIGTDKSHETIEVTIPQGIDDGAKLRLRGRGQQAPGGAGDLILTVRVGKHPHLRREGLDLFADLPVTIAETVMGASVRVRTPKGELALKVPVGANSGQKLRIAGRGVQKASGEKGDFYAVISVQTPRNLSAADREAIAGMAARLGDPRGGEAWPPL